MLINYFITNDVKLVFFCNRSSSRDTRLLTDHRVARHVSKTLVHEVQAECWRELPLQLRGDGRGGHELPSYAHSCWEWERSGMFLPPAKFVDSWRIKISLSSWNRGNSSGPGTSVMPTGCPSWRTWLSAMHSHQHPRRWSRLAVMRWSPTSMDVRDLTLHFTATSDARHRTVLIMMCKYCLLA